ncbi:MAG: hypothetical protein WCI50_05200 [Actinomycetes bacterium]
MAPTGITFIDPAGTTGFYESCGGDWIFVRRARLADGPTPVESVAVTPEERDLAVFLAQCGAPADQTLREYFSERGIESLRAAGHGLRYTPPVETLRRTLARHVRTFARPEVLRTAEEAKAVADGWAAFESGRFLQAYGAAVAAGTSAGSAEEQLDARLLEAYALWRLDDREAAVAAATDFLDGIRGESALRDAWAHGLVAGLHVAGGADGRDPEAALPHLAAARVAFVDAGAAELVVACFADEADCLDALGRHEEAQLWFEQAVHHAEVGTLLDDDDDGRRHLLLAMVHVFFAESYAAEHRVTLATEQARIAADLAARAAEDFAHPDAEGTRGIAREVVAWLETRGGNYQLALDAAADAQRALAGTGEHLGVTWCDLWTTVSREQLEGRSAVRPAEWDTLTQRFADHGLTDVAEWIETHRRAA